MFLAHRRAGMRQQARVGESILGKTASVASARVKSEERLGRVCSGVGWMFRWGMPIHVSHVKVERADK